MGMRREMRLTLALPVQLSGLDASGQPFEQSANTIHLTTTGARIGGVTHRLQPGGTINVIRGTSKGSFRVVWVGKAGGPEDGQIGVQLTGRASFPGAA